MARTVLLDTGFLVALVNAKDPDHARCRRVWEGLRARILSVEGVLVEAAHLLRRAPGGPEAAVGLIVDSGAILVPSDEQRLRRAASLMKRYRDVPMDLVDSLLVATAEDLSVDEVLTLDVRGFSVYRRARRRGFRITPQPE